MCCRLVGMVSDSDSLQESECLYVLAERSISVVWACRQLNKDMNECLHQYTTDEELEKWKEQYAAKKKSAGVASNKFSV